MTVLILLIIIVAVTATSSKSGISTGAIVGIVLGTIAFAVTLSAIVTLLILRTKLRDYRVVSKGRHGEFLIMNHRVYCFCSFSKWCASGTIKNLEAIMCYFIFNRSICKI